jgi:hypothetical protein
MPRKRETLLDQASADAMFPMFRDDTDRAQSQGCEWRFNAKENRAPDRHAVPERDEQAFEIPGRA